MYSDFFPRICIPGFYCATISCIIAFFDIPSEVWSSESWISRKCHLIGHISRESDFLDKESFTFFTILSFDISWDLPSCFLVGIIGLCWDVNGIIFLKIGWNNLKIFTTHHHISFSWEGRIPGFSIFCNSPHESIFIKMLIWLGIS